MSLMPDAARLELDASSKELAVLVIVVARRLIAGPSRRLPQNLVGNVHRLGCANHQLGQTPDHRVQPIRRIRGASLIGAKLILEHVEAADEMRAVLLE